MINHTLHFRLDDDDDKSFYFRSISIQKAQPYQSLVGLGNFIIVYMYDCYIIMLLFFFSGCFHSSSSSSVCC